MGSIDVRKRLSRAITDPTMVGRSVKRFLDKGANAVLREYVREIPKDTGRASGSVRVFKPGIGERLVTTKVTNRNFRYPLAVHEGTGDFAGSSKDYGSRGLGAVRDKGKKFNYIDARSGKKGIRPNKFADRALKEAQPKLKGIIDKEVKSFFIVS